ncbi:hypothetical protein CR513_24641, partial [Mucuna pruriens]
MATMNAIPENLPVFDGKGYEDWCMKMDAILGLQELDEIVKDGFQEPSKNASTEQKEKHRENKRLDYKAQVVINSMRACDEAMTDSKIVEKVLRTLTPSFDHIVVANEESKDLEKMIVEELQNSLKAHEQRSRHFKPEPTTSLEVVVAVTEEEEEDVEEAEVVIKMHKHMVQLPKIIILEAIEISNVIISVLEEETLSKVKVIGNKNFHSKDKKNDQAHLAQEEDVSDSDQVLLMVTTSSKEDCSSWYLDTGCSNHMTGNRDWLVDFNPNVTTSVRFADNSTILAEGIRKVMITRKNREIAYMHDVLYIPSMKNNLLSLGQLLEKGFTMAMQANHTKIFDDKQGLVLKAPLSRNRTFKKNCEGCLIGKQPRKAFKTKAPQRAKQPLGIVHSDVCGPFDTPSLGGNRCPTKRLQSVTPEEAWTGDKPMVNHLRIFGSLSYRHIPDERRRKLDDKSEALILIGYHPTGAYKLYSPLKQQVVISRDVVVDETAAWKWKNKFKILDSYILEDSPRTKDVNPASSIQPPVRSNSSISDDVEMVHFAFMVDTEPIHWKQALDIREWKAAMKEELDAIEKNRTWKLVDLPHNKHPIDVRWVFKVKLKSDGSITKHKARLVAKGFLQKQGIDYTEVYAPVARMETIRLVIAVASSRNWTICQLDVKSAFLNGPLEEEIYILQPPGFEIKGKECK